jgi:ketosteroid isomerase-like protein
MKGFTGLIVVLLALAAVSYGQTTDKKNKRDAKVEQELRDLIRTWDEADMKADTVTLNRLLAEEFTFVGGPTKAEYLAGLKTKAPDLMVESATSTEVKVNVYRDAAVVTGLDTLTGKNKGQPFVAKWLYMDVWIKRGDRWQCVKTYSSRVKG